VFVFWLEKGWLVQKTRLPSGYRLHTERTQNCSFFTSSWWYRVNILPIIVLALDTKLSLRSEHFFLFIWQFFSPQIRLNHSVPLLVSVGPTAADIKTERKCFQCSEWVWDDHPINTVKNQNMQRWLGTIIIHTDLFHISVPSYDGLFLKKIVCTVLYSCIGNEKLEGKNFWSLFEYRNEVWK
jgi:hypothetical protein